VRGCVNATIPRHERAVLTAWPPARAGRRAGHQPQRIAARARTPACFQELSALPPKADVHPRSCYVAFVPRAEVGCTVTLALASCPDCRAAIFSNCRVGATVPAQPARSYCAFSTGLKSSLPWKYTTIMQSPPSSHLSSWTCLAGCDHTDPGPPVCGAAPSKVCVNLP
jgi:hypothetical protein